MPPQHDIAENLKGLNESLDRDLNSIFYNNVFLNTKLKGDHQTLKHMILSRMNNLCTIPIENRKHIKLDFKTQLPLVWNEYQSLCIKWFYEWKSIIKQSRDKSHRYKDVTVECRVFNSKLAKLLKAFHRFYYEIIEYITCHFDTSLVIPTKLISDLNLEGLLQKMPHLVQTRKLIVPRDKSTSHVVLSFYHCLLSLGKIRYHQVILEDSLFMRGHKNTSKRNAKVRTLQFRKAERYWSMAVNLIPSKGATYKQLSKLSMEENNYTKEIYFSVRRHFARVNDNKQDSHTKIIGFFKERKWGQMETSSTATNLDGNNLLNGLFEIMRHHILIETNEANLKYTSAEETERFKTLKNHVLVGLQTQPVLMNGAFTNDHIITLIGIFSLSQQLQPSEGLAATPLRQLTKSNQSLLKFILDIVSQIIGIAKYQLKGGTNLNMEDMVSFLAIIRVINCWLKLDNTVLSYAHRYKPFCEIVREFMSTINEIESLCWILHENKRPKRSYLFEEDVMLKEFTCIDCRLTDFDDTEIFDMEHVADRLIGHSPKTDILTKEEEFQLRLRAVVISMKRFLRHNKWGIKVELDRNKPLLSSYKNTAYSAPSDDLAVYKLSSTPSTTVSTNIHRYKITKSTHTNNARKSPLP